MDNTAQMKWTAFLIDQNKHMTYLLLGNIRRSQMKRMEKNEKNLSGYQDQVSIVHFEDLT